MFYTQYRGKIFNKVQKSEETESLRTLVSTVLKDKAFNQAKLSSQKVDLYLANKQGAWLTNFPKVDLDQSLENVKFNRFLICPRQQKQQVAFPK